MASGDSKGDLLVWSMAFATRRRGREICREWRVGRSTSDYHHLPLHPTSYEVNQTLFSSRFLSEAVAGHSSTFPHTPTPVCKDKTISELYKHNQTYPNVMYTWYTKRQNVAGIKDDHVWDNPFKLHLDFGSILLGSDPCLGPRWSGEHPIQQPRQFDGIKDKHGIGFNNPMGIWILIVLMVHHFWTSACIYNHRFIVLCLFWGDEPRFACVYTSSIIFFRNFQGVQLPPTSGEPHGRCIRPTWTVPAYHGSLDQTEPCRGDPGPRNWKWWQDGYY